LKFEHKSRMRVVSISDLKSRKLKFNGLRRMDVGGPPAFEIRMGYSLTGVSWVPTWPELHCANPISCRV